MKQTLTKILHYLHTENIPHALIGALAMEAYGIVRATQDIDFILHAKDKDRFVNQLESYGFQTHHRSQGFSNHFNAKLYLGIDAVYVRNETADKIFAAATPKLSLHELTVPVVSLDHLISLKIFAVKNNPNRMLKDFSDIKALIEQHPEIDYNFLRERFIHYGLRTYYEQFFETQA